MNYCEFVVTLPDDTGNPNQHYHDMQYGFPVEDDNELFEWLVLGINQTGLSWTLMLKKQQASQTTFKGLGIDTVVAFDEADIEWLFANASIVRSRLRISAAIYNMRQIKQIQQERGSFKNWLDAHHPLDRVEWMKLFKKYSRSVGGEIVGELLVSTGYLPDAYVESYSVYRETLACRPKWVEVV